MFFKKLFIALILIFWVSCSDTEPKVGPDKSEMYFMAGYSKVFQSAVLVLKDVADQIQPEAGIIVARMGRLHYPSSDEERKILLLYADSLEVERVLADRSRAAPIELGGGVLVRVEVTYTFIVQRVGPFGLFGTKVIVEPSIRGYRSGYWDWVNFKSNGLIEKIYLTSIAQKVRGK